MEKFASLYSNVMQVLFLLEILGSYTQGTSRPGHDGHMLYECSDTNVSNSSGRKRGTNVSELLVSTKGQPGVI
jgi:hypothetical protein